MNRIPSNAALAAVALLCAVQLGSLGEDQSTAPPLPPLPKAPPASTTVRTVPNRIPATAGTTPVAAVSPAPSGGTVTNGPTQTIKPVYVPVIPGAPPGAVTTPDPTALAFDNKEKEFHAKAGETQAKFSFALTNVSKGDVTIYSVSTSCGCTAAKLPSQPWILKPGDHGEIGVTTDLTGKSGTLFKTATVNSSAGPFALKVTSHIPTQNAVAGNRPPMGDRAKNLQIAAADRQAVFRNDCASCHVQPTIGKHGQELFATACGICHEPEGGHRATFVTNLRTPNKPTNADYWTQWITNGREGSLMPAFAKAKGGPLDEEQIKSLVDYLESDFKVEVTLLPGTPQTSVPVRPARPVSPLATD